MNFNITLNITQANLVIKGIECLRESTSDLLNDIVGQIQSQANMSNAKQMETAVLANTDSNATITENKEQSAV